MRSISSTVIVSAVRSQSFVVFGEAYPAIRCTCSSVPPFDRYAVIPVARHVWQQVDARQPRGRRPALDHGQHGAAPQRPPRQPPGPVDALKQRRRRVLDAAGVDVRRDSLLGPVGPARRGAYRLSRATAATRAAPAGSSPAVASPPLRSPARSCRPARSAAPGRADRPAAPGRSGRGASQSRPASARALRPSSRRTSVPARPPRGSREDLADDEPVAEHADSRHVLL